MPRNRATRSSGTPSVQLDPAVEPQQQVGRRRLHGGHALPSTLGDVRRARPRAVRRGSRRRRCPWRGRRGRRPAAASCGSSGSSSEATEKCRNSSTQSAATARGRCTRVVAGGVHRVPVVHRRLLHLVAGHEGDVLLPAGPGPAEGGLVGLPQHLDQPGGPGHEGVDQRRRRRHGPGAGDSSRRLGRSSDDRGPEPVHLGQVRHQVGHRPAPGSARPGRRGCRARPSAKPALCWVIAAMRSNVESVMTVNLATTADSATVATVSDVGVHPAGDLVEDPVADRLAGTA